MIFKIKATSYEMDKYYILLEKCNLVKSEEVGKPDTIELNSLDELLKLQLSINKDVNKDVIKELIISEDTIEIYDHYRE